MSWIIPKVTDSITISNATMTTSFEDDARVTITTITTTTIIIIRTTINEES
jgi:hypothetical protein